MGHAVYSISDPRARIFKTFVEQLAKEKHREKDYRLYAMVEELAPKIIGEERHIYKVYPQTSTSTAASFTACWIFRWSSTPRCSPARVSSAGVHTGWRN